MNLLDVLIVLAAVAALIGGYRLGFVTRALSWAGLLVGLVVAARVLPPILRHLRSDASEATLFLVALGVFVAGAFLGQVIGLMLGSRLNLAIHSDGARRADQLVGAVAGVAGVLLAVWLLMPAMASVPGWPAREARTSAIARGVEEVMPRPPNTAQALRQLVGSRYPDVFDALQPAPALPAPPADSGLLPAMSNRAARSTVKILGRSCALIQEGTGFTVAPDLIATNAHVVAGEHDTYVERSDGVELSAQAVAFDPQRDLALLRVRGLDRPALPLAAPAEGEHGGVFGHPGGGPLTITPFEIGRKQEVEGNNIYNTGNTGREVLFLAADLAPGDSGGPLVVPNGTVVGVAFAIAPDRQGVSYALSTSELRALLAAPHVTPVGTGPCTSG